MNGKNLKYTNQYYYVKFLADHMLGRLAKYLRFLGYDTFYPDGRMSDDEILIIAREEQRIILTRDRELALRSGGFLVRSDDYHAQLKEVVNKFNLNADKMLTRCSVCNAILVPVAKEEVKDKIPEYVYAHNKEFYLCPQCGRVYWYGTHTDKIKRVIEDIIPGEGYED